MESLTVSIVSIWDDRLSNNQAIANFDKPLTHFVSSVCDRCLNPSQMNISRFSPRH